MERVRINIYGIVQGVGFRPFIHKAVIDHRLTGYIKNTSSGVEIEAEGDASEIEKFISTLPEKAPKLAVIENISVKHGLPIIGYKDFEIKSSRTDKMRNTLISPDICICDDCLRELNTPGNRRYKYPFINCTNCGPRFTIIKDVPYDRVKTSMGAFPMCHDCEEEYHDINNRRYHAQPDCCSVCGPEVFFAHGRDDENITGNAAIEQARRELKDGRIIAVKGLGGIHLACRCDMPEIVSELRLRKHRDEKPFAIMCRDTAAAEKLCEVSDEEKKILESFRRPITLLRKKIPGTYMHLSENEYIGIMLPYTPLHYLLLGDDIDMLVMTSANISDEPIIYSNDEALEKLSDIADGFLLHNRDIVTRCDDSLCWTLDGHEYFARRSRGYVPFPVRADTSDMLFAAGAEQKASFCLSKENYVFPSQHIGDLKNYETLENYEQQAEHFKRLFDIVPAAAACDMHPDYLSTQYAESLGVPLLKVQHHHAHMAACMADNDLEGKVTGLIWDGTGLGTDGTIWGSECLSGGYGGFDRIASIKPIPLIGGDRAVKEIDRVAFALLSLSGESACSEFESSAQYAEMLSRSINCPLSSGMGRLFDGAAAILGIKDRASYEGQGAVLLEAAAERGGCRPDGEYPIEFYEEGGTVFFDWRPIIKEMVNDRRRGKAAGALAAVFMNTLMKMAVEECTRTGNERVVLSGGTFQNMYIMHTLPGMLEKAGFEVFRHRRVSCNDEGISLGQLCVLQYHLRSQR